MVRVDGLQSEAVVLSVETEVDGNVGMLFIDMETHERDRAVERRPASLSGSHMEAEVYSLSLSSLTDINFRILFSPGGICRLFVYHAAPSICAVAFSGRIEAAVTHMTQSS